MRHSVQQEHSLSRPIDAREEAPNTPLRHWNFREVIEAVRCPSQHMELVGTEVHALKTVERMTTTSLQLDT